MTVNRGAVQLQRFQASFIKAATKRLGVKRFVYCVSRFGMGKLERKELARCDR